MLHMKLRFYEIHSLITFGHIYCSFQVVQNGLHLHWKPCNRRAYQNCREMVHCGRKLIMDHQLLNKFKKSPVQTIAPDTGHVCLVCTLKLVFIIHQTTVISLCHVAGGNCMAFSGYFIEINWGASNFTIRKRYNKERRGKTLEWQIKVYLYPPHYRVLPKIKVDKS